MTDPSAVIDLDRVRVWRAALSSQPITLTEEQAARLRQFTNGGYKPAKRRAA